MRQATIRTDGGKGKIRVSASVPALRMKARFILGIVEKGKIIGACPGQ